jgi:hypothetical protein
MGYLRQTDHKSDQEGTEIARPGIIDVDVFTGVFLQQEKQGDNRDDSDRYIEPEYGLPAESGDQPGADVGSDDPPRLKDYRCQSSVTVMGIGGRFRDYTDRNG